MRNLSYLPIRSLANLFTIFLANLIFAPALLAQPKINSFSPKSAPLGVPVIITGSNFDPSPANNIVYVGGIKANVISASAGSLTVQRISAGDYSPITVTSAGLTGYSADPFITTFPGSEGVSTGSFAARNGSKLFISAQGGTMADFDGDGKPDLAITESGAFSPFVVSILRNTSSKGRINFDNNKVQVGAAGAYAFRLAVADFNGDGRLDIALLSYTLQVYVYKNTSSPGSISFAPARIFSIGASIASDIKASDLDGDGRPEILAQMNGLSTGQASICICRNTSSIDSLSFESPKDYLGSIMSLADINGDSKPELAIDNKIYENRSVPGKLDFVPVFTGLSADVTALTDLDGDGLIDFLGWKAGTATIYKNQSANSISFDNGKQFASASRFQRIADINGDGKPDIISSNYGTQSIGITANTSEQGNLALGNSALIRSANDFRYIYVSDLDGDGKQDMLVTTGDSLATHRNITGEPLVASSGNNPVTGEIIMSVTSEPTAPVYNNITYLQKRYDIEPVTNPSTASASITLAYSQGDFNAYNANPSHGLDLPSGPADVARKANFRIFQHHGTSATGAPGTYSGSVVEINPDDSNIIWNDSLRVWQVTFNVEGFSGFFAGSANALALPAQLTAFGVLVEGVNKIVSWTSVTELNVDRYEIEKGVDGLQFSKIATLPAKSGINANTYRYNDLTNQNPVDYFRLKIIDRDGSYAYSKIVKISAGAEVRLTSFPNPVTDRLSVLTPITNIVASLKIIDKNGQLIKTFLVEKMQSRVDINVQSMPAGNYSLVWSDGKKQLVQTILVTK